MIISMMIHMQEGRREIFSIKYDTDAAKVNILLMF